MRCGAQCWVLYPCNGRRPVAEGIVGSAPTPQDNEGGIARTLLVELCKDGKQMVKVTKVHKKTLSSCTRKRMQAPSTWSILQLHLLQTTHGLRGQPGTWWRRKLKHDWRNHVHNVAQPMRGRGKGRQYSKFTTTKTGLRYCN